jgi:putative tricarboxylic transport membrane protein
MASDRIFGLVVLFVALGYIASATQIQTSFLADPVGPKAFPILIGAVAALCALVMIVKPDPDPDWPSLATFGALAITIIVLVAYAYALKPLGFIIPTAITAGILSYQISNRPLPSVYSGVGLSVGLFLLFDKVLDLGLFAFPKGWIG